MAVKRRSGSSGASASAREERLKAALKANLARRKAQARARAASGAEDAKSGREAETGKSRNGDRG